MFDSYSDTCYTELMATKYTIETERLREVSIVYLCRHQFSITCV